MINPFFIKLIGLSEDLLVSILHKISLPNVTALTRLNESIVDMIVAIIPTRNMPKNPEGRISNASIGYVRSAWSGEIVSIAYSPQIRVRKSNIAQKKIENRIPFFAVSGFLAAEHL